jgi:hypothetical protein
MTNRPLKMSKQAMLALSYEWIFDTVQERWIFGTLRQSKKVKHPTFLPLQAPFLMPMPCKISPGAFGCPKLSNT